jgi:phage baseplate assembly protein W
MSDLSLEWGGDFVAAANGDLLLASGEDETRQAICRRLFTAVQGYIFHPDYGAGLPQKIGSPANANALTALVSSQIAFESAVNQSQPVNVSVIADANQVGLYTIMISYTEAVTGVPVELSFTP